MPEMLRILFVTNLFPPVAQGGYELWCQEVAHAMHKRGHSVSVLTGRSDENVADREPFSVHRVLHPEVSGGALQTIKRLLGNRKHVESENINNLRILLEDTQPDVVFVWGMWNIPRSVPAALETYLPRRVLYYFCDYWPSLPNAYIQRWEAPAKHKGMQVLKGLFGKLFLSKLYQEQPPVLRFEHPVCVSRAVRDLLVSKGVAVGHARIIYGGTQVEEFSAAASSYERSVARNLKLLFVGRLVADKGVHTAIEALRHLPPASQCSVILHIYGKGDADYEAHLHTLIHQYQLEDHVSLCGSVPRSAIPELLTRYHALVFPSVWEEPFARTPLEAMAAGMVVLGTTTGGTGEILTDGETGLTFPAENAHVLAQKIQRLLDEPDLSMRLSRNAQERVHQQFTFERMVNEIEELLQGVFATSGSNLSRRYTVER
jgi:glycosyltransferase involved in cell wall biosynthesis